MSLQVREPQILPYLLVQLEGTLGPDDCRHFVDEIDRAFSHRGMVRVLIDLTRIYGASPGPLWEPLAIDPGRFGHIDRIAVLGEPTWQPLMQRFTSPFKAARVRYFEDQREAEAWLAL